MYSQEQIKEIVKQAEEKVALLLKHGDYKEAELILGQLLKVDPGNAEAQMLLGLSRYHRGKNFEAIPCFEQLLANDSSNADAHNNIALCYAGTGKTEKAQFHISRAIELDPENPHYKGNQGLILRQMNDLEGAIIAFHESLALKNDNPRTWTNLGSAYGHLKNITKARECFEKAITLDPTFHSTWVDLAHTYFLEERWEEGFSLYEHRSDYFGPSLYFRRIFPKDKQLTQAAAQDLEGKTVVIYCEQGAGDLIHFCRFIPVLQSRRCTVYFHPYETSNSGKMVSELLKRNFPNLIIDTPKEYDYHCSLLSLPYLLEIKVMPQTKGYLRASKQANLKKYDGLFKIGITWAGSPLHPNDQHRSLPLRMFKPLHDLPGVKLFSLQKDLSLRAYSNHPEPVDLAAGCSDMKVVDMSEIIQTFDDTAAIVEALDLVITVDTSLLHLSGALGQRTWGLIPFNPDWRWGLEKDTTIWYPHVKLFRQKTFGDWDGVFDNLRGELHAYLLSN